MEIDDKWQAGYGELDFDLDKFPDPKAMVEELHDMGFKVTLWVMPFVEENTEAYREGAPLGYFVQSDDGRGGLEPGFFKWWNTPPVVALDVTNPKAVAWFVARLEALREKYGVDGYKFDAGEPCFLPRRMSTHRPLTHPSEYTRAWVERVAARFELAEVRTGHQTTGTGLLTRMGDRFSEWGNGNGLRSIIPPLLTSGVMGYPFCLPDRLAATPTRTPTRPRAPRAMGAGERSDARHAVFHRPVGRRRGRRRALPSVPRPPRIRATPSSASPTPASRSPCASDVVAGPRGPGDVPNHRSVRHRR